MNNSTSISIPAVLLGIGVSAVMLVGGWGLQHLAYADGSGPIPAWYSLTKTLAETLVFLPGLVAGYAAARAPLKHGLLVAIGPVVATVALTLATFGEVPAEILFRAVMAGYASAAITSTIGAIVGIVWRRRLIPL